MINNIRDYSFEECKEIISESIKHREEYLQRFDEICDKFDCLINHIIKQLENGDVNFTLSEIDMINAIRINQALPFFMLEDKYDDIHKFANAWILILQNLIAMTGDNNKQLEESVSVVAKLLRCDLNFSRLIYLSEMLLNKYEYIQSQVTDMESYKLSKLYIDKILKQDTEEKED